MKILFVSASPIKKELSIGNTFLNLFENMDDVELASICTRAGTPDSKISRCFCITEKMIVNNVLKNTPVGMEIDINKTKLDSFDIKTVSVAKKYRLTAFFWIQDLIWSLGLWKSKNLENFINDYNPDVIFSVFSNSVYLNNLITHIKKISGKKLVLYAWDNNYSLKRFMLSPFRWIKLFIDRVSMRKLAKQADMFYVISDIQKKDYESAFNKECKVLTKSNDFSGLPSIKSNYGKPFKLVYTGNIGLNRWKSLSKIVNVLDRINFDGVKAQLYIYTGNKLDHKIYSALNREQTSFVMGSVAADKIVEIQRDADMLVHIEALDIKNRLDVRQSFSTKIVDYLATARPILAFGPKCVASIDHLIKNNCAIVSNNENDLFNKLYSVINDESKLDELSIKAFECGKRYHNKEDIDYMLRKDLEQVIKGV